MRARPGLTAGAWVGLRRRNRIGVVTDGLAGRVTMRTLFGGTRIVDMLVGAQLPRIC